MYIIPTGARNLSGAAYYACGLPPVEFARLGAVPRHLMHVILAIHFFFCNQLMERLGNVGYYGSTRMSEVEGGSLIMLVAGLEYGRYCCILAWGWAWANISLICCSPQSGAPRKDRGQGPWKGCNIPGHSKQRVIVSTLLAVESVL